MRKLVLLLVAIIMVSCSPGGQKDKNAELQEYKKLVMEYTEKIELLENELGTDPSFSEKVRSTSVEVKKIGFEKLTGYFETTGTVEAIEDVYISPEINGQIKSISAERGSRVKKGDLLISLNTEITQKGIDELKTSLALSARLFEKQEELWKNNIGSELQYLEAKNGKELLEARLSSLETQKKLAYIEAPFDGIVEDIMVKTGELASPGMRLIRLVNLDKMRVTTQVSESFLSSVYLGEIAEIRFSSLPGKIFRQPISRIGTVIDPITRTFSAEVLIKNNEELLKPNMISSVKIEEFSDDSALVVPSIILRQDFNGTFLYLASGKDSELSARKAYVEVGRTIQDKTKVVSGLQPDDLVIVKGYNLVSEGTPVSIVN